MSKYPQTYIMRYMGSKIKLIDFIVPKLEKMIDKGDTVLDLMAGTHAIGYALKPNHPIIANDIQNYSKIIGISRIENNSISVKEKDLEKDILSKLEKNNKCNLFQKNYKDTYFSTKQCKEIDDIRCAIDLVKNKTKKSIYLTALIYAMGYCQSSPGHFAQYMPKDNPRIKKIRELSILESFKKKIIENHIVFSKYKNKVLGKDYRKILSNKKYMQDVKLVYVDPPYSEAQYSRFYHLLETVVKYDYPKIEHKGLYRNDRFQSNFCYKNKVLDEFKFIAEKSSSFGSSLAISYSDRGLVKLEEIVKICKIFYKKTKIYYFSYSHSMQGRGVVKDMNEVLITAKN